MSNRIIVVGGGPAGMMASLMAKEQKITNEVILLERNVSLGKKLLLTGNGRCNLSNEDLSLTHYNSDDTGIIKEILEDFTLDRFLHFLQESGLMTYHVNGGIYPYSNQAKSVLEILNNRLKYAGVKVICDSYLKDLVKKENGYHITYIKDMGQDKERREELDCNSIILACGGKAAPSTGSDGNCFKFARKLGLEVSNTYPVLVQLKSNFNESKDLSGIRCRASVTGLIYNGNETIETQKHLGELQITDYGISGILVFNLSRELSKPLEDGIKCEAVIDFLPDFTSDEWYEMVLNRKKQYCKQTFIEFLSGLMNEKLLNYLLKRNHIDADSKVELFSDEEFRQMIQSFHKVKIPISGHNGYQNAQATKGGVLLSNLTHNLEAVQSPGLYFAGEMLDVDGECGGYNLHWAFASGYRAGKCAGTVHGEEAIL